MDLWVLIITWIAGLLIGLGIGIVVTRIQTSCRITLCRKALRKIEKYKWYTGKRNDAMVITQIVMQGLKNDQ